MKDKPLEIRWSIYCLVVLILMNVASFLILFFQNEVISNALLEGLGRTLPAISVDNLKYVVKQIILRRNLFHLVVITAWTILAYMVYRDGKEWTRALLVIFTLISFVGSIYAFSTTSFISLQILAVLGWVGRIILLWLLLIPQASRAYFARSPII